MGFAKSFLIGLDQVKPQFLNIINLLDHNVQMRILSRNLSFAVDLDKQNCCIKVDQIKPKFEISNVNFIKNHHDQSRLRSEISDYHGLPGHADFNMHFVKKFPI